MLNVLQKNNFFNLKKILKKKKKKNIKKKVNVLGQTHLMNLGIFIFYFFIISMTIIRLVSIIGHYPQEI